MNQTNESSFFVRILKELGQAQLVVLFGVAALGTIFFPVVIKEKKIIQWRTNEVLSVKLERNLIGALAFDQIHKATQNDSEVAAITSVREVTLEVDKSRWTPETLFTRKLELAPLVISRLEIVDESELPERQAEASPTSADGRSIAMAVIEKPQSQVPLQAQAAQTFETRPSNEEPQVAEPLPSLAIADLKKDLPRDMQRRLEVLEEKGQELAWQDKGPQDVSAKARSLIRQLQKDERPPGGGNAPTPNPPQAVSSGSRYERSPGLPTQTEGGEAGFAQPSAANQVVTLDGPVEVFGGLGFTNDSRIEIRRVAQGVALENGRADIVAGKYFIRVNDLRGRVVGQFYDGQGRLVGEGSFNLGSLKKSAEGRWQSPALVIQKKEGYLQKVVSLYQLDHKKKVSSGTFLELHGGQSSKPIGADGIVEINEFMSGSTFLAKAVEEGSYPSQWISGVGDTSEKLILPGKMLDGFLEYLQEVYKLSLDRKRLTVIVGRATKNGIPAAGVAVQLKQTPEVLPIYFDGYVPSQKLQQTSESGLFAFVNAGEGVNTIMAKAGFRNFAYINVLVENGIVAFGSLESGGVEREVGIRSFDAFSGDAQQVRFGLEHQEQMVDSIEGEHHLSIKNIDRWGQAIVHPFSDNYMPARYSYSDAQEEIFFPLIQRNWLKETKGYLRLSDDSDSGTVVGFVSGEDYEIFIPTIAGYEAKNMVYFDAQGEISETPAKGGGFILFNLSSGLHQVILAKKGDENLRSQVVEVENENLSVLRFVDSASD